MSTASLQSHFNLYSEEFVDDRNVVRFGMFEGLPRWVPWFLNREHVFKSKDGTRLFEVSLPERMAFPELGQFTWLALKPHDIVDGKMRVDLGRAEDYLLVEEKPGATYCGIPFSR